MTKNRDAYGQAQFDFALDPAIRQMPTPEKRVRCCCDIPASARHYDWQGRCYADGPLPDWLKPVKSRRKKSSTNNRKASEVQGDN